ncbi:hypothetical protein PI124_g3326 [Phytophthora idaei]|nr:hypothetical protein PI125_g2849 [Phytophthora idaei]KAG3169797.1 hypothetical protein PI126_g2656 [Phytophthora idaei]KAG3252080.1 hypothetical protein PI124_g3326 [Phytophthora idaei]
MRSFNNGGMCGLNSQAGYLFERSQSALRQRSFGRARGIMGTPLKRSRDQDSDSDEEAHRYPWRRHERSAVLDGIKRMRVTSPTDSPKSDVDSGMTDEEAATPRATWRTNKAIVPAAPEAGKKRPLVFATPTAEAAEFPWKTMRHEDYMAAESPIEIPSDASCRAMVVFNPYQSMPSSPAPRVELVEDDKQIETDASESEDEHFVRFEELPEDNGEPVDMDVD